MSVSLHRVLCIRTVRHETVGVCGRAAHQRNASSVNVAAPRGSGRHRNAPHRMRCERTLRVTVYRFAVDPLRLQISLYFCVLCETL